MENKKLELVNGIHLVINSITAPEPSLFTIADSEVTVNETIN